MELSPQQDVYYIDTVSPIDYFIDTVTPSAIQLNKEKIMSIELDGPLYLGSNSLQQQVDQNTEDITELQSDVSSIEGDIGSLDNLATSDKSSLVNAINETLSVLDPTQTADYIKNSKGLESGEISTNASILPWVEEMSHSTFDLSKFTVVGSPNITDDGIASGFSGTSSLVDYIIFDNDFASANNWEILFRFNTGTLSSSVIEDLLSSYIANQFRLLINSSKLVFVYTLSGSASNEIQTDSFLQSNTSYWIKIIFNGSKYSVLVSTDSINYIEKIVFNSTTKLATNTKFGIGINIGSTGVTAKRPFSTGSIDLKQFSVTVDGVEVFSGNKTGIDTIKPDDYQVVGTPTISAEGVASGFSSSNYIKCPFNYFNNKLKIRSDFYWDGTTNINNNVIWQLPANTWSNCLVGASSSRIAFYLAVGSTNTTVKNFLYTLSGAGNYTVIIEWTGTTYIFTVFKDNVQIYTDSYNSSSNFYYSSTTASDINIGYATNYGSFNAGSIDLNAFKIYVDGNLVYQPCLKIPFTLSKTGAKIVDSIYRDRVTDMYEQFGYAPYYTLDTTNSNYTIPKGEVYGMVNKLVPTLVAPDYSKPVSLTYSSGLVMENDGWLEVQIQSSEATANPYVSINGSIICRTSVNSNGDLNRDTAMMVVRKGDIITSGGYSANTAIVLTYYPFKV